MRNRPYKRPKKINTENKFAPLATEEEETAQPEVNNEKPPKRIPPIVLRNVEVNHDPFVAALSKLCIEKIQVKYAGENTVRIFTNTQKDYVNLTKVLEGKGAEFFSYTPSWEYTKKVVMKGLPQVASDEMIKEDLKEAGIKCLNISVIKKKSAPMPTYPVRLLQLAKETDMHSVYSIKHICSAKITWATYNNKKGTSQCHRCQGFGHGARHCNMNPKCVKCGQDHLTAACAKKPEEEPRCANCQGEHPASYSKCPKIMEYQELNAKRAATAKRLRPAHHVNLIPNSNEFPPLRQHINRTNAPTTQRVAWATIPAAEQDQQAGDIQDVLSLYNEIEKLKKLCNIKSVLGIIKKMNIALEGTKTDEEGALALINVFK